MPSSIQGDVFVNISEKADSEKRGAVYTRPEVVDFILDLVGYTIDQQLHKLRILEPSFGEGDFLIPVVDRLLRSYKAISLDYANIFGDLSDAVYGVEVHADSFNNTYEKLIRLLKSHEVCESDILRLLDKWLVVGDFLLAELPHSFSHVVGNPPYVRQELIPDELMSEYRARYSTIYDRADLYIPFYERCLRNLNAGGVLGFICADRWMKNKYGGPLRAMVAAGYHLKAYIDMVNTHAFHSDVFSYPAITIIKRENAGFTRVALRPNIDSETLSTLADAMTEKSIPHGSGVVEIQNFINGSNPWLLQSLDQLGVLRRLEMMYPLLEDTKCKVRIGVATGADKVYIAPYESLDVENDRKLPLVTTKDIDSGILQWRGLGVINPFQDNGQLVDLAAFPKLNSYLKKNANLIQSRNIAKKNPTKWYRTIDRIYPNLARQPKLLIPDIKGTANVVYEDGNLYPHHNLYFITSEEWDLRALQAILLSNVARLFIVSYSTQMRGGYLRFQAQYLRRIRLPRWKDVPSRIRKQLIRAANIRNFDACNKYVYELYRLTAEEIELIESMETRISNEH